MRRSQWGERLTGVVAERGGDAMFVLMDEPWIRPMIGSTQNPEWHQEQPQDRRLPRPGTNDVFNHTWLVLHYSDRLARQSGLAEGDRLMLLMAALFHDVGKPLTRRIGCRGIEGRRCNLLFRTESAAAGHAAESGHRHDPGFIRNLGHESLSADAARRLLAGWPPVETVASLIADHIAIGQAWRPDGTEPLVAAIRGRCRRPDLLILHYWADKAGGMPMPFPLGLEAGDLPGRIAMLRERFRSSERPSAANR